MPSKILSLAEDLVKNFTARPPQADSSGAAFAAGRSYTLTAGLKAELERHLERAEQGADPGEIAAELLKSLGKMSAESPVELVAGELGSDQAGPRQTRKNQLANQVVQPLFVFYPRSLNDPADNQSITAILERALSTGSLVKAAGSGHSYSDVATTPDFFINTHGLNRAADPVNPIAGQLNPDELRSTLPLALGPINWPNYDPEKNRALFETEAGITIRNLNKSLESRNLGLMNMGGYDGQTIIGATSTSTHGSGITLGPFPDMVRSLVLATSGTWDGKTFGGKDPQNGVALYRIEPADGITDPNKYSDPVIQLIQDDGCFRAVICSMGCFGVIYSVVFEVMQMYWLEENRTLTTLRDVIEQLRPNPQNPDHLPDALINIRNFDVLVHPYPMKDGEVVEMDPAEPAETYYPYFQCLITARNIVPRPDSIFGRSGHRNIIAQFLSLFNFTFEVLVAVFNRFPTIIPEAISLSMPGLVDTNYINKSFDIYNLGLNQNAGFATEIGFALKDSAGNYTETHFQQAVDRIHRIAQRARVQGEQYQTSPFSLRFVKASQAQLSMMQGIDTCMIEMDMVTGTYGGPEVMQRYQESMYELGGRPHWGLEFDHVTGSNNLMAKMYPQLQSWLNVYNQFNRKGTFNSSFTDRVGFTNIDFER
jgi:D-arabinono-1,4-lactone oxidase/FAD binding domain